jgi:hypothetical protein
MTYIMILIGGLIGMSLHSWVKIKGINDRTPEEVGIGYVIKTYFRKDFPNLVLAILFICLEMIGCYGYLGLDPDKDRIPFVSLSFQDEVKFMAGMLSAGLTYMAESLIMAFNLKSEKYINDKVNNNPPTAP